MASCSETSLSITPPWCYSCDFATLQTCKEVVEKNGQEFGRLDFLVNNAAQQHMQPDFTKIDPQQLASTFSMNVFGYFYMAQVITVISYY
jgi:NAD(P)-dependent dehydrogenase (short-subunit alcohol dehydrogenase family)